MLQRGCIEADHGHQIGLLDIVKKGFDGQENRPKSGRLSNLPEKVAFEVRKKSKQRKQGWITQQVSEMIVKEGKVHLPSNLHLLITSKMILHLQDRLWQFGLVNSALRLAWRLIMQLLLLAIVVRK